ncbi:fam-a protein [Plasmodium chabaudi chabaudi]|uniref:Fam-a protein n=1 Tax=Plasmodium chabaudi chabaudi TaxID=31271 RepID=A0A4V0KB33_PLACU|nr:fam-a protein [Plasmodium chabaudi chabaudi]VTZ70271.1 fam-a protein [Plasmodium chabaudi chabaudi]|eukprot:XP_016654574.1 fam-a protein [Plasmodium chabaudi chabaudi]
MNKSYIKIALALLSVIGYIQNVAFASESASSATSSNGGEHEVCDNPKGVQQQFYDNPKEIKHANKFMSEALSLLKKHVKPTDDYEIYKKVDDEAILYFKTVDDIDIGKLELTIPNADNYDGIINMLWDPRGAENFDGAFIDGSLVRIYNENLVILEQRHSSMVKSWAGYYHALAKKFQLSENETTIVLASSNINVHDPNETKKFVNPLVKSAKFFNPVIDSAEDIREGQLSKMYINLLGFIIKREPDCVKITYLISVDTNFSWWVPNWAIRKGIANKMYDIIKLRDIFHQE